jgi:hypothetical protein
MSFSNLAAWRNQPWESKAEEIASLASPRYSDPNDEAYREACYHKTYLSMSTAPDANRVGNKPNVINVPTPGSNTIHELEDASAFSSVATPEEIQAYADLHADDPLALDPRLKITPRVPSKPKAPVEVQLSPEQQKALLRGDILGATVPTITEGGSQ